MSNTGFAFTLTICVFIIVVGAAWLIDSAITAGADKAARCEAAGGVYIRDLDLKLCIKKEAVIPL